MTKAKRRHNGIAASWISTEFVARLQLENLDIACNFTSICLGTLMGGIALRLRRKMVGLQNETQIKLL